VRLLHDPVVASSIRARVGMLTAATPRRWGTMSVDQMLWHVNQVLRNGLGHFRPADLKIPLPKSVIRFIVIRLPWPKGAPTLPEATARERYSFDEQRDQCLALIDEFTSRPIDAPTWGHSGGLGDISGRQWSELQAKHLDHHLRQFGV
jgi:hypothetical protein